jgi:hypothetical protein
MPCRPADAICITDSTAKNEICRGKISSEVDVGLLKEKPEKYTNIQEDYC